MEVEVIIGFVAALAAFGLGYFLFFQNSSEREAKRLNEASVMLMKEKYLNKVITGDQNKLADGNKKLLIKLTWKEHGKNEFVIDQADEICF